MVSELEIDYIKNLDFYKKVDTSEWCNHGNYKYIKVSGDYPEKLPICSVVIRTYKRAHLLMRALNSVLHQEGFDDFVVLIVDNEGIDLKIATDTSRVVSEIKDDRVIYYRSVGLRPTNTSGLNAAASLVRTRYFVFLNDDDVFHNSFLRIMLGVMMNHEEIDALMCEQKWLYENNNDVLTYTLEKTSGLCRRVDFSESIMSLRNNTTGVIYKTSSYQNVGGTIEYNLGCNDVILANRFDFYHRQYLLDVELHGICVRDNNDQLSRRADYYRNFFASYYWRREGLKKYYHLPDFFIEGIIQRRLRKNIEGLLESCWNVDVSECDLFDMIGIIPWKKKKTFIKKLYNLYGRLWDKYTKYIVKARKKQGFIVQLGDY